MVTNVAKAIIQLDERSNRVPGVVRAYEEEHHEPELRREYIEKLKKLEKEERIRVADFDKQFGLE